MEKDRLYSKKLSAGKRTYFFDLKKAKDGSVYLVITEQKEDRRNSVMVFEERLGDFISALQDVANKMRGV